MWFRSRRGSETWAKSLRWIWRFRWIIKVDDIEKEFPYNLKYTVIVLWFKFLYYLKKNCFCFLEWAKTTTGRNPNFPTFLPQTYETILSATSCQDKIHVGCFFLKLYVSLFQTCNVPSSSTGMKLTKFEYLSSDHTLITDNLVFSEQWKSWVIVMPYQLAVLNCRQN